MDKVSVSTLFAPLPTIPGGYGAACPDPPWRFASNSDARPGRNARRHYRTLKPDEIATLPLRDVMAKDAYLFLWVPTPFLVIGAHIQVMRSWGFKPTALGFAWVKLRRGFAGESFTEKDLSFGPGLTLRRNIEVCVLGRRGRPSRLDKSVFEVIVSPVARHSEKPDEAYRRIERYCAGPYLELFARKHRAGWTSWGDGLPESEPRVQERRARP
jgi:N6-adenosine-specific RNA methylase IME4